jgi:hypothetical protein
MSGLAISRGAQRRFSPPCITIHDGQGNIVGTDSRAVKPADEPPSSIVLLCAMG